MSSIDKDIKIVVKKLRAVKTVFKDDEYQQILAKGAKVAQDAIRQEAPTSSKAHSIINDGGGYRKVKPGNLKKSIQVFSFKRSPAAFAGVVVSKKAKVKKIRGYKLTKRFRAYYWKMVFYGTPTQAPNRFVERARTKAKGQVLGTLKQETKKHLPKRLNKIFD